MFRLMQHIEEQQRMISRLAMRAPAKPVALVLAGGDGTRLQELTREITGAPIPKQYCPLLHGRSLLEATLHRVRSFASVDRTLVIINQNHLEVGREQLRTIPRENVLIQPSNRDTGPGMLFALIHIAQRYPNAIMAAFPSDHYVDNDRKFIRHVLRGVGLVTRHPDKIAILGVTPDRPETGYGYILPSSALGSRSSRVKTFRVQEFQEKPTYDKARDLISGGALWNTFVMVFRLSRMVELLRLMAPAGCDDLLDLIGHPERAAEVYRDLIPWNFSTQFLARIPEHLIVLRADNLHWSDWGTRAAIERTYSRLQLRPAWQQGNQVPALQSGSF